MKKYFKIDDLFRCRFKKYEVCPPKCIWEFIKVRINKLKNNNKHGKFPSKH
jgi:hypothetical protein